MTRIVMQIPLPAECFMHNFPVCGHTNQHFAVMAVLIQIPPDSCAAIRAAFTFHYGSTYTKLHRQLHEHHILFTFHYGSTYTRRKAGTWQDLKIYIPLWFYLYWM